MGLLETEIKELRQMQKQLIDGSIKPDVVNSRIAIYSQTEKRAKMMLQAFSMAAKHGKKFQTLMERSNLTGDGSAIDTATDAEVDMIKCPGAERIITRGECLDKSGSANPYDECDVCHNKSVTQDRLLGPKE